MTPEEVVRSEIESWYVNPMPGAKATVLAAFDTLIAERDEAKRKVERATDETKRLGERIATLEARLNEAREALERIVEHAKEQPVPLDPIAFNCQRIARDALASISDTEEGGYEYEKFDPVGQSPEDTEGGDK